MDVLIVEDDDLMADLLETVVAGLHSSIAVQKATSLKGALDLWHTVKPCLLIVDWNLPDGSGLEFVRQVRASDTSVAIVMISGRADRESILKAAHFGINGYISKPFNVESLHERLKSMVGGILPDKSPASLAEMLAGGLDTVIQLPARTDPASVLALMEHMNEISAGQLAERWQNDVSLCARLLDVANRSSFRRTGEPVNSVRDAILVMGVPMAINQALALSLDITAAFSTDILREYAARYQQQAEAVAMSAQRIALALSKRGPQFYTAGLLSRIGELAVLKVMDQYLRQGGSLSKEEVAQSISEWAQGYGNRLKVHWLLPLALRQLIGAVHVLSRESVTQDLLVMRAGALLADSTNIENVECGRLLRQLGLEEWQKQNDNDGVARDD
ncbi:MAG TPA: response regulator [Marinobacter sp.]|nr:response regulator [Marinobacter sp.]